MNDVGTLELLTNISKIADSLSVLGILLAAVFILARRSLSLEKKNDDLCKQHKDDMANLTKQIVQALETSTATMREMKDGIEDLGKNFNWEKIIAEGINNAIKSKP